MSVYLSGRSLACALGTSLSQAISNLHDAPAPAFLPPDINNTRWPYFQIPYKNADWYARARHLVQQAIAEAGIQDKSGVLFLASSSFDIGVLENGKPFPQDSHVFAERVAQWLDWQGQVYSVATACTSSLNAMRNAIALIHAGIADSACILGLELSNLFSVRGFSALQLLSQQRPRPLCIERDGLALGEAVSVLYLTKQASRWRIAGCENIVDGSAPTAASKPALSALYQNLCVNAGLDASQVDFIKLHATGNPDNDEIEAAALAETFCSATPRITFKHLLGHTLGASGAAEVALLTACLEHQICPPLPDGTLDATLNAGLATQMPAASMQSVRYALATILGFGGGHAAVLLEDTTASI